MTIALWIVNALLALLFVAAGATTLLRPRDALSGVGMTWVDDFSAPAVKAIGALEVLGAIGLVAPVLLGVAEILTPLEVVGLVAVMTGAILVHRRRKETVGDQVVLAAGSAVSAVLGFLVVLG